MLPRNRKRLTLNRMPISICLVKLSEEHISPLELPQQTCNDRLKLQKTTFHTPKMDYQHKPFEYNRS